MKYIIDESLYDEGGYCQFYAIVNHKDIGFKEFESYDDAISAFIIQQKLSKHNLSPQVYGNVCRLSINNIEAYTNYGYITQIAEPLFYKPLIKWTKYHIPILEKIQHLVDDIKYYYDLDFWDCHQYNIGVINNNMVCIDTGKESFDPSSNAWGLDKPGPKCGYCSKYICTCEEIYAVY